MPRLILALLAFALLPAASAQAAWRTVTFDHTVQAADRAALDRAGARAVHPSGARSYVAYLERAVRIRGASVRRIAAADKIAAGLRPGASLATVVRLRGGRRITEIARLDAALTPAALARRADVLHVGTAAVRMYPEDEGSDQIQAGNLVDGKPAPGYDAWLEGVGHTGKGVRISIVDTGLDASHPDLEGKVVERFDYELPAPVNTPADADEQGHGTHVAGIVAGNPDQEGPTAFQDDAGFYFGLGVAPGADLVAQNGISLTSPDLVPLIPTLTRDAVRAKAFAWNASWHTGEGTGAGYLESVRVVDGLVRDGDQETPGLQPFTMVFSAGNEGSNEKTITVPKEAKNIITVGASKGQRAGDPEEMANFSSRGPARDGRIEPTIVAPGEAISSARSKPAGGLCFEPVTGGTSPIHSNCSGTSMAAPHVAGAVAMLVEWWRRAHGADPSPAMVKALLVNSATDIMDRDVPNGNEGWGRVDLGRHFATPIADRVLKDQTDAISEPGATRSFRIAPVDPAKPLRATIVWTDPPGKAATTDEEKEKPALINDLDLTVQGPDGSVFRGNAFAEGRSVAGGAPDRLNNVENVWLDQAGSGAYTVTVAAHALPGDGVPLAGDTTDQDYALAIANARVLPDPPALPTVFQPPIEDLFASLQIRTRRAKLARRVRVALRTTSPVTAVRATLSRKKKRVATAKLSRLKRSGKVVLRLPRRTKPGTYILTVKARDAKGRAVAVQRTLKLTR